ncbi:hydrolase 1, exosortase A system-associated [Novosphingobium sp. Chol11]|uniref:hydrolase 1, exosortase A system-associated n=1 Tax=Novosphingobium sp. Chol11 TaxID=1385763 RepID=UPI0025D2DD28|nr:hydrolase 1, exosortase A system-associated [Novosphingobium sp. Chol11]
MSRAHITFACEGAQLVGSLDRPESGGEVGILLVSGGNEIRCGAWGGQGRLAARLAASGITVLRYDRRGIGDSEGTNSGFRHTQGDIAAALAAFRAAAPELRRIIAFGNYDAASALMLHGTKLGFAGMVLANPWTIDDETAAPVHAPAALRARYLAKLRNPRELLRLLGGKVNLGMLLQGLKASAAAPTGSALARDMAAGLAGFGGPVAILLASADRTAQLFEASWPKSDPRIQRLGGASHSFSGEAAQNWLTEWLIEAAR